MSDSTLVSTLPVFTAFNRSEGNPLHALYRSPYAKWTVGGETFARLSESPVVVRTYDTDGIPLVSGDWINAAHAILQEALVENAHRDALRINDELSRTGAALVSTIEPLTAERDEANRTAQAQALAVMRAREDRTLRDLRSAQAELERLRAPITEGSDERLKDFWRQAAQVATSEGFCPEYDRLAARMGGVRREDITSWYDVDVEIEYRATRTVQVRVQASNESQAMREAMSNYDNSDLHEYMGENPEMSSYDIYNTSAEDANISDDQEDNY